MYARIALRLPPVRGGARTLFIAPARRRYRRGALSHTASAPGSRVGQRIADRYELTRLLGSGGMGEVYEGSHLRVGKRVAVKCLWPIFAADPAQVERFEREARVASMVDSPHLVDVFDAGALEDGTRFLVMELLEGVTLHAELGEHGPL